MGRSGPSHKSYRSHRSYPFTSRTCPSPKASRPNAKRRAPVAPALAYRLPALDTPNSAFAPYRLMPTGRVLRSGLPRSYEK
jgi:hypothetical protein